METYPSVWNPPPKRYDPQAVELLVELAEELVRREEDRGNKQLVKRARKVIDRVKSGATSQPRVD